MGPGYSLDPLVARLAGALRPHRYVLPVAAVVLLVLGWMVTYGTGDLFDKESFGEFYDGQALGLLSGRLDVPRKYILDEAFVRDGKSYGYYGVAPALLHVPAVLLWPDLAARWSRLSHLAACAVSLAYAWRLLHKARAASGLPPGPGRTSRAAYAGFLVTLGLGSTLLFLVSRPFLFHEAAIWGAAFALGSYDHLCAYLAGGRARSLAAAGAFGFLSFLSRASVGAGTLVALLLTVAFVTRPGSRRNLRHAALAAGSAALTLLTFVSVNYAKFHTFFDAMPVRYYSQYLSNPARLRKIEGRQMSPANVRSGARAYLNPTNLRLRPRFPWVYAMRTARVYPEARYDLFEPYAGLPALCPAACALAAAGLAAVLLRRLRPGALVGAAIPLAADVLTCRYLHDAYPFLVVAGAFGVNALLRATGGPRDRHAAPPLLRGAGSAARGAAWGLLIAAALFSVWANFAVAIVYQRAIINGVPGERQRDFKTWQAAIDRRITSRFTHSPPATTDD